MGPAERTDRMRAVLTGVSMSVWKQLFLSLVVLAVAAVVWARFYPGAPEILARWGLDWAEAAARNVAAGDRAEGRGNGEGRRRGGGGLPQLAVITQPVERATINDKLSAIG